MARSNDRPLPRRLRATMLLFVLSAPPGFAAGEQSLADRTLAPGPTPAQQAVAEEEKARLRHAVGA